MCAYLCMLCHSAGLYSIDFPRSSLGCKEGEDPWATTDIQNHLQGEEEETRHHVSATIHIQWLDHEMNNKMSHPHTAASVFYACVCVHRNTHITTTWSAALLTQIFFFFFFYLRHLSKLVLSFSLEVGQFKTSRCSWLSESALQSHQMTPSCI